METVPTSLFLAKLRIYLDKRKKPLPTVYHLKELLKKRGCLPSRLVERQPTIGLGAIGMFLMNCPFFSLMKKAVPQASCPRNGSKNGGCLLSRLVDSTIGATGLNFSVRDGKRWNPGAITTLITRQLFSCVYLAQTRTNQQRTDKRTFRIPRPRQDHNASGN